MKRPLLIIAAILATSIAIARSDGIYNPSSNSVGDYQGIDSNKPASGSTLACSYSPVTTGTQSVAYTGATPAASGGTPAYTFSETGALPTGLTINTANGVISGTPSVSGTFAGIQVAVADTIPNSVNCGSPFTLVIAPAFQGPGDVISGAIAWGSCARAYNAAYANGTNPLCDLKDKTTGTVAICTLRVKTTGFVDLTGTYCTGSAAPATACAAAAGGSCVVSQVYDQTGNANHFIQATLANMPALVFSAVNGLPDLTGTNAAATFLATSASFTQAQPFSMSIVYNRTGSTGSSAIAIGQRNSALGIGANNAVNSPAMVVSGTFANIGTNSDNSYHCINGLFNGASSIGNIDGIDSSALSTLGATGFAGNPMGVFRSVGASFEGHIAEVGIWLTTSFSAGNRSGLCTNQRSLTNGYNF